MDPKKSNSTLSTTLASAGAAAAVTAVVMAVGVTGVYATTNSAARKSDTPAVTNVGSQPAGQAALQPGVPAAAAPEAAAPVAPEPSDPAAAALPDALATPDTALAAPQVPTAPAAPGPAAAPEAAAPTAAPSPQAAEAPARSGTPTPRDATVKELYVRAARPNAQHLGWQYAAYFNTNIPLQPKIDVTYNGEKARRTIQQVMTMGSSYNYFGATGSVSNIRIAGDTMKASITQQLPGFPKQTITMHWVREDGLWKYELKKYWKDSCTAGPQCDSISFGY